jgi:glucose/arabinose dehydrogenase
MKHLTGFLRIASLVLLGAGIGSPAVAQSLPAGFVDEPIVGGLTLPTAFTTLPDGRLLVAEKDGVVRVIQNGQVLAAPLIDLRSVVNDYWDHGLIGIAADLNFTTNGFVYLLYTYENNAGDYAGPKTGRLTRVTATGNVASLASAVTILGTSVGAGCSGFGAGADCLPSEEPSHSVGSVKVAPDGTLFVTSGEGANFNVVDDMALRSQDLASLGGKLLHITTGGKGLPGNPFWTGDPNANRSKVYAYGFRNPFRLVLDPVSGVPYIGDVCWGSWEEVNAATAGANFGWPCYEGVGRQPGYEPKASCQNLYAQGLSAVKAAEVSYYHSAGGSAVAAGAFQYGTAFSAQYQNVFFYADSALRFLRYFRVNSEGVKIGPVRGFGVGLNGPVYLEPDGQNLLYLSILGGDLRRIRYTGANPDISYLSDQTPSLATNGWGPYEPDQSNGDDAAGDGRIITLNTDEYAKGLGVNAPSELRFTLGGACSLFSATVGIDDEGGTGGSVVFRVYKDSAATPAYDSGLMTSAIAPKSISLNMSGVTTLRLVVDANGDPTNDHADWADAKVTCTNTGDITPPTVTAVGPAAGSTAVAVNANVTGTFSETMSPPALNTATVMLVRQGTATPVAATVSYSAATNTVTLDPSADLAGSTVYTATIKGGAAGAKDVAGNALLANRVWAFTTAPTGTTVTYLSDRPYTTIENGSGPAEKDRSNGGSAAGDGRTLTLNKVTYAKGLGVHARSDVRWALGGSCSLMNAVVGVDDEVGSSGSVVFQVFLNGAATPIYDSGVMTGKTATKAVSVNLSAVNTLQLVVTPGIDGNTSDHGDWADARVTCSTGDTTAPTVTATSPVANATTMLLDANVTATFSEALGPATVSSSTVTLVPLGSATPVPATVTYAAATNTVTLDPTVLLAAHTTYTARIKGGASGVTDVAGNPLAADKVWTFTTNAPPTPAISQPRSTFAFKVGDLITYAGSASDVEDGNVPAGSLHWSVVLFHCPSGNCHQHPFTNGSGTTGSFTAPDHGDDSYFEITLTATDSAGLTGATSVTVLPQTVQLTLATVPTGLQVVYGGINVTAPATFTAIVGGLHTILAPSPQAGLTFAHWSDGAAQQHNVSVGATNVTYTATFTGAPTVTAISPGGGANGVALTGNVTGTFSAAMLASTLTGVTVTLVRQATGTPVAATVTYSAATQTVTLDPAADLQAFTVYTATIKGGASGVKSASGTPMAADKVWTFTTAIAAGAAAIFPRAGSPDFDGDGTSDVGTYRRSSGLWSVLRSTGGSVILPWGVADLGDTPVPADYDGDGRADVAVYRSQTGEWFIVRSSDGTVLRPVFGVPSVGDVPVPADYDGDGRTDLAVYRASTGIWFISQSSNGVLRQTSWGVPAAGDVPVAADYDGDHKADLAVYRLSTGQWFIVRSSSGAWVQVSWGMPAARDVPVVGDYDHDGKADPAVYRQSTGEWLILRSTNASMFRVAWGVPAARDLPVPGDYDGDGTTDVAVYRATTGEWFIVKSAGNIQTYQVWGQPTLGDMPLEYP